MPTPSDSEFFELEGFFMRWTTFWRSAACDEQRV
jgi:hypothetical protein